jgi:RimJ/RimL family protein N-acetyltransferase
MDEIDGVRSCAVVRVKENLAGLIWIYRNDDISRVFHLGELDAELNGGYILPEYRGRGLFRAIIVVASRWLFEAGYRTVYAGVHSENLPSLRAFRGAGFSEVGSIRRFLAFRPKISTGYLATSPLDQIALGPEPDTRLPS